MAQQVERKDKGLRDDGRPEHGGTADLLQEKSHEEYSQHHAVENGANDVDGFDQVFREPGEQRKSDSHDAPQRGKPFSGADIARFIVGGERTEMPPEING